MRAVIASGTGRYADPWHPFPATSPILAAILADAGHHVEIDDDVDGAMTRLDGVDLLVVNAGDPWRGLGPDAAIGAPTASIDGFVAALDRGIGVLAVHCAVSSLRDYPEWPVAIGAMWVPGLSWHPPAGPTTIHGGVLPDGTVLDGFDVVDERYLRLQRIGRSTTVAEHDADADGTAPARREPSAWVRTVGASRVAVDALGHDEHAYESDGHRRLIARLAAWCTA